ncbi:S-type pyocin domain-containing protein [Erwinia papayae]|uniref:S-type pyocin domain-containing protein n=1 Tax=Erwinia papayae TaxID=206499 RepID=A0ABV3N5E0_9GAMM
MKIESYQNGRPYTGDGLLALGDEMTMVVTAPIISISSPDTLHPFDHLFVLPAGMERQPYRAEPFHFDPNNLPFISLRSIRDSEMQINRLIDKAMAAYPKKIPEYEKAAQSDITMVNNSNLKSDSGLKDAADILQESLNALKMNIDLKNSTEQDVIIKTQLAEEGFYEFVNDKSINLSNLNNKQPEIFDVALSIICGSSGPGKSFVLKKWHELYVSRLQEEIAARNNLVTYLSLVKTISEDVSQKILALREIRTKYYAERTTAADKRRAESAAKAEVEAKVKAQAKAKASAEAKAKAKEALAKSKAEKEAQKAQTLLDEQARSDALKSVGLMPALSLQPGQEGPLENAMKAAGVMVLNRAAGGGMQLAVAGQGTLVTTSAISQVIASAIRTGVAAVLSSASLSAAAVVLGFWPKAAGKGSDQIPGRDVAAMFAVQAEFLTGSGVIQPGMKTIEMPVRGSLVMDNGHLALKLLKTGDGNVTKSVQILDSVWDGRTGLDIITVPALEGLPAQTVLVNPWLKKEQAETEPGIVLPGSELPSVPDISILPLPGLASPVTPVHTGTEIRAVDSIWTTTTSVDEVHFRDFIYWQLDASGTGVEPVYIMLSNPRNVPGIVTGNGELIGEGWLNKAGQELGAPIPSQIAEVLRGREFTSFDAFRRAVWKAASEDPDLNVQFKIQNQQNIANGKSPFVRKSEQAGGRKRHELHHVAPVNEGGAVYDIDNIRVMTPKRHIEIHKGGTK